MTGRGAGYCAGYGGPGYANPMPGRGFGMGWGRGGGRGWRHQYYATGMPRWSRFAYAPPAGPYGPYAAPPTPEQESGFLEEQARWLKDQLDAISQRIAELERQE